METKNPLSRIEQYLAAIAGGDNPVPDHPLTRVEEYLNAILQQGGGSVDPDEIRQIVEDWLAEHVDPETGYVLDDTLSIAGAAADAKAAGDAVDELKSAISVLEPTATDADVGKTLIAKTVADGKVTEYEFGETSNVKPDGYYQQMTVGNAEQLVATVGIEDKVPYNFRTSGGSNDIGDREVDKLVGGTVAWNQRYPSGSTWNGAFLNGEKFVKDHKVLFDIHSEEIDSDVADYSFWFYIRKGGESITQQKLGSINMAGILNIAITASSDGTTQNNTTENVWLYCSNVSNMNFKSALFIDLTQMFGSTIADYIYSLETATAGAGVVYFRKLFPAPYYAYNAGELMSVQTSGHKMVGFNQFDKSGTLTTGYLYNNNTAFSHASYKYTDYIRIVGGATYHVEGIGGSNPAICWYDADKNYIAGAKNNEAVRKNITFPSNACYVRISFPAANVDTLVFNLHWDGERNGEYEPYEEHVYPLDSDLVLRGIPKQDANNNLYYDGDEYADDGTVTRKYNIVDLGTLDWMNTMGDGRFHTSALTSGANKIYVASNSATANMICPKYTAYPYNQYWQADKQIFAQESGYLYVYDTAYESAAAFKTAMSGVYLVYELATPTTETADPYTNPQIVDDWGTEEYIDERTIPIPVGHDTMYRANLRAKLEMLPNSPDSDGDYVVRHSNGENEYVVLEKELPTAPTTDGNYHLKLTVSGTTKTLVWEADT